jgi:lipid-A-disaccharide synthase
MADCPAIVCYRLSAFSWFLARTLVHVNHASIVNLIANDTVVPEYLQYDMTPEALVPALTTLLQDTAERRATLDGYRQVREALGEPGVYDRAAQAILTRMRESA